MPCSTDICAARRPSAVHGYLMYALGIHENISRPWSNISCAIVLSSEKTSIDTPASPTNGEIVCTIFLYSSISSLFESLCPDAISSLMCGFLAIKDGLVVCPSTNPNNSFTCRVSCVSPPSTNILVLGRVIEMLHSVVMQTAVCGKLAGATGLEPAASCVTGRRSNQLNYAPVISDRLIPSGSVRYRLVPSLWPCRDRAATTCKLLDLNGT